MKMLPFVFLTLLNAGLAGSAFHSAHEASRAAAAANAVTPQFLEAAREIGRIGQETLNAIRALEDKQ